MNKGKLLLTGLLLVASLLSGVLLFTIPISSSNSITELDELYEQIDIAIEEAGLQTNQFRKASIEIDSTFSRSVYRINVPPSFSKTSFHLALHHQLIDHEIYSPAKITFPEENMDIHVVYKNTVFRTIRLITTESIQDSEDNG
jgi:hypothetical protein